MPYLELWCVLKLATDQNVDMLTCHNCLQLLCMAYLEL